MTYRELVGIDCDDFALKCSFAEPKYLQTCGDIHVSEKCPTLRRLGHRIETHVALPQTKYS